ncbi:hypothetical protein F2Q69_00048199 [Brassica cretica]|uniref:Uncharacterized protein n=1 Tax=Brassica cretica TaxID=69181 RepID=A0A8S9PPJ2_BRACR|nr:hypothetical protein F2Q69_00048199 [Brassica cretica]
MHLLRFFIHRVAYRKLHPLRFIHRVASTGLHPKPVVFLSVQNFVNAPVAFLSVQNFMNEPNKIQNKSHRLNNISSSLCSRPRDHTFLSTTHRDCIIPSSCKRICHVPDPRWDRRGGPYGSRKRTTWSCDQKASVPWPK